MPTIRQALSSTLDYQRHSLNLHWKYNRFVLNTDMIRCLIDAWISGLEDMRRSVSWFKSKRLFLSPRENLWAGCNCLHWHISNLCSQAVYSIVLPVHHICSTLGPLYVPLSAHDHRITTPACHRYQDKQSRDVGQGHLALADMRDGLRNPSVFQRTTASDLQSP